jgi:hypothetical protein
VLIYLHKFLKTLFMKKLLFAFSMIVSVSTVSAQINKGQWLVGGDASFSSSKQQDDDDDNRETNIQISPNAGYFFMNNLAGGLRFSFSNSKVKGEEEGFSTVSLAPFIRYYFLPAAQKVNIFADASYGFGSAGEDDKTGFNFYSIKAGPAVFLTPNTALEFTVGYSSAGGELYEDFNGDVKRFNSIGLNVGFQIHLGGGSSK